MTIITNKGLKHITVTKAEKMYLDYVNNFITLSAFAEYYGISYYSAERIVDLFRNRK